jgi:CheY-like chemotaxis protein
MRHILLVEDDMDLRDIYTLLLEQSGFRVTGAQDGEEALARVSGLSPDLIITDVTMPRMNGLELCRRLHQDERLRRIPILIHSSDLCVQPPHGEAFIAKGSELTRLLDLIHRLIGRDDDSPSLAAVA